MKTRIYFFASVFLTLFSTQIIAQATLSGVVTDENGAAVVGAKISIENTYIVTLTDVYGAYKIEGLQLKTDYKMHISSIGFNAVVADIRLSKTETEQNFTLTAADYMTNSVVIESSNLDEQTPMTFNNLEKEELEKMNFGQDIPFLLDEMPSTVVSSDAGAGIGYTGIRIRGTDPTRTNVTVNGIPLNDSESHGVFWVNMPDFASSVDNIQVQRGVGSSSNGGAAFGAGIHMTTNTVNKNAYGEIENAFGSFNSLRHTVRLGTGLINNQFSLDARLSKISSDGYIDRASSDLRSFYLSGAWLKENHSIRFNIFSGKEITYQAWNGVFEGDLESNRTFNSAGMYFDENGNVQFYDNEVDNYSQTHYQLHYSGKLNSLFSHALSLHYTRGFGYFEQFRNQDDFATYGLTPIQLYDQNLDTVLTINTTDLVRRRWLDNHFFGAVYGLGYNNKRGLELNWGLAANQYIGDHFGEIIWARFASQSDLRDRYYENQGIKSEVNSYVRGNYQKGAWNFFGEMHYRFIDYQFEGLAVVNEIPTITDQVVNFNFLNPKAGFSYQINNKQNIYFSYAKANREPVRDDFTESSPNSRPKPEQLHNIEAAYLLQKRKFTLRTTSYFMYYIDQLVLNGQINDVGGFTRTNVDESYRLGLEIEAGFKASKNLQINATAALSRNKILEFNEFVDSYSDDPNFYEQVLTRHTNTDISFSPNVILGGKISYTPMENLELVVIGKYVGQQYLDNTQNASRVIDAFAYGNFRANYIIKDWLFKEIHLGVLVNNFTNALFVSNGYTFSYLYNNGLTTENYFYPQAGTNFLCNIKLRF